MLRLSFRAFPRKSLSVSKPIAPSGTRTCFRTYAYGVAGATVAVILPSTVWLDSRSEKSNNSGLPHSRSEDDRPSFGALVRSYLVYTMCSIPALVDNGPQILSTLRAIPILRQLSELFIRESFFKQFVGGETVERTFPLINKLRKGGVGCLLAYSVEHDENTRLASITSDVGSPETLVNQKNIDEMAHSIQVAGDLEAQYVASGSPRGKTSVALKLSALLQEPQSMERFSIYLNSSRSSKALSVPYPHTNEPGDVAIFTDAKFAPSSDSILTPNDVNAIRSLYEQLRRLCILARDKGIPLVIDAEHTWYTPAIDTIGLALSREFNRPQGSSSTPQPLIYATYQSYLRRGTPHLAAHLADARREGYVLGVKLVRGAYQSLELDVHQFGRKSQAVVSGKGGGKGNEPPVWTQKEDTDRTYHESVELLISTLASSHLSRGRTPAIGVIFATHNRQSCDLILSGLLTNKLATRDVDEMSQPILRVPQEVSDSITFAQLLGMRDDLTDHIASQFISPSPIVMKYVPYGTLEDVIPFLARRAIENKSVLGAPDDAGARGERRRAGLALKRRLMGFIGL